MSSGSTEEANPVPGFWEDESTPYVRRLLLDEAAGKHAGATRFEFNIYAVLLDFDAEAAVVEDLLGLGTSGTVPLREFLAVAESYRDDPSIGDGLTQAERNPPRFRAQIGEPPEVVPPREP